MFISARTERMALTRSMTQPISASAASSWSPVSSGQGLSVKSSSRATPPSAVTFHSSSVMNGMKGWSSARIWSRAQATVAQVSVLPGDSGPSSTGLASSMYQSQ